MHHHHHHNHPPTSLLPHPVPCATSGVLCTCASPQPRWAEGGPTSHRQLWISKNGKKSHMGNKEHCAEERKKPQLFHLSWKE